MDATGQPNTGVFKEPLGFIRVLILFFAVLAFSTTCGYDACMKFDHLCSNGSAVVEKQEVCWEYPFLLSSATVKDDTCGSAKAKSISLIVEDVNSQAQFFVFTGVMTFLYCLLSLGLYVLMWDRYTSNERLPMVDLLICCVSALFWFAGSCAWASGVNTLKNLTTKTAFVREMARMSDCAGSGHVCNITNSWDYASLNVSLIAGFACFGLWAANCWFVYKETDWFKSRTAANAGPQPPPVGHPGMAQPFP